MILESQEEDACLYVFGLLPEAEAAAFEEEMNRNDELAALVASLSDASVELARSLPASELSPDVRRRLLDSARGVRGKVVPLVAEKRVNFVIPWAVAACLAALLYWQAERTGEERDVLKNVMMERELDLRKSRDETANLRNRMEEQGRMLNAQLAAAEQARVELLARVTSLEARDVLAQTQIAVLGSQLKDRPQAVAVSLWNQEQQDGLLVVENLPVLEVGKDYQLWVLDPGIAAPVSAGVFKVGADGKVRISFKPTQTIANAAKFAVSLEKEGGVVSPTMDQIVVIGGS